MINASYLEIRNHYEDTMLYIYAPECGFILHLSVSVDMLHPFDSNAEPIHFILRGRKQYQQILDLFRGARDVVRYTNGILTVAFEPAWTVPVLEEGTTNIIVKSAPWPVVWVKVYRRWNNSLLHERMFRLADFFTAQKYITAAYIRMNLEELLDGNAQR